jgi:hypothetical protein
MIDIFSRWEDLLKEIQEKQLQPLLINQHIFRQFAACTEPYVGSTHASALSGWMGECFVAFAATAIRRTLDRRHDTISLVRFLNDLQSNCGQLSRERVRMRYRAAFRLGSGIAEQKADEMFDYGVGRTGLDRLSAAIVKADITHLESAAASVTTIANTWITHTSRTPNESTLELDDLHDAIDTVQNVYSRYHALVTCNEPAWVPLVAYNCTSHFHRIWPPK